MKRQLKIAALAITSVLLAFVGYLAYLGEFGVLRMDKILSFVVCYPNGKPAANI